MICQNTIDFVLLLLILGVVAFVVAMIAHALKRCRRRRMIDPVDHRKWKK